MKQAEKNMTAGWIKFIIDLPDPGFFFQPATLFAPGCLVIGSCSPVKIALPSFIVKNFILL